MIFFRITLAALVFFFSSQVRADWLSENNCHPMIPECCEASECCGKVIIGAGLLIWRPYEKGLDRCGLDEIVNSVDADGRVISRINNKNHSPSSKWKPGFRIGAGYETGSDWAFGAAWTHFDYHSKRGGQIHPLKWNLHYDTIDILARYALQINHCFNLMPFAGLRAARIDQSVHGRHFIGSEFHNKNRQNFNGIGPEIGLEALCNIGCNFSIYATTAVSWLYGRYKIKLNNLTEFEDGSTFYHSKRHFCSNQFVADASIGIQWNTILCGSHFFARIGLEHHQYFDYNHLTDGDLSFSGGTVSAGIEF